MSVGSKSGVAGASQPAHPWDAQEDAETLSSAGADRDTRGGCMLPSEDENMNLCLTLIIVFKLAAGVQV